MTASSASAKTDPASAARDARWLAHRYDPGQDAVHFVQLSRDEHRALTFLRDDELPPGRQPLVLRRVDALAGAPPPAPIHFVFHSAYCCSTLVARAFDRPGVAMGLKEPTILQDLTGWRWRGGPPARVAEVLDGALRLLARPFGPGEAVVVKPSNIVNGLARVMLAMRPEAGALLLHAPLPVYLASIARKGMWGRLWVRELLEGQLKEGMVGLGFAAGDHLRQTDLQVAAVGWLAQQALFARLAAEFGGRVRTLDSETLTARPADAIRALAALYRLPLDEAGVGEIAAGPAFTRNSKTGAAYSGEARAAESRDTASLHADEIGKVTAWGEAVAQAAGVPMVLPNALLP